MHFLSFPCISSHFPISLNQSSLALRCLAHILPPLCPPIGIQTHASEHTARTFLPHPRVRFVLGWLGVCVGLWSGGFGSLCCFAFVVVHLQIVSFKHGTPGSWFSVFGFLKYGAPGSWFGRLSFWLPVFNRASRYGLPNWCSGFNLVNLLRKVS